jgi:hypothetical protein
MRTEFGGPTQPFKNQHSIPFIRYCSCRSMKFVTHIWCRDYECVWISYFHDLYSLHFQYVVQSWVICEVSNAIYNYHKEFVVYLQHVSASAGRNMLQINNDLIMFHCILYKVVQI